MTPEKLLRYLLVEDNLRKTVDLRKTGIIRADFYPGSWTFADYVGLPFVLTLVSFIKSYSGTASAKICSYTYMYMTVLKPARNKLMASRISSVPTFLFRKIYPSGVKRGAEHSHLYNVI